MLNACSNRLDATDGSSALSGTTGAIGSESEHAEGPCVLSSVFVLVAFRLV
jgi:hypothetical protein